MMFLKRVKLDSLSVLRKITHIFISLLFFLLVVLFFPLTTSPDGALLETIGPGVVWIAATLAALLVLPRLFEEDFHAGVIDQWLLNLKALPSTLTAKLFAYWLMYAFPLIAVTPLVGLLYHLTTTTLLVLMVSLLLGTPILLVLGATIAALTMGVARGSILLAIVLLPLYIPVLVMGAAASFSASHGLLVTGQLAFLAALCVLAVMVAPRLVSFALRMRVIYG